LRKCRKKIKKNKGPVFNGGAAAAAAAAVSRDFSLTAAADLA